MLTLIQCRDQIPVDLMSRWTNCKNDRLINYENDAIWILEAIEGYGHERLQNRKRWKILRNSEFLLFLIGIFTVYSSNMNFVLLSEPFLFCNELKQALPQQERLYLKCDSHRNEWYDRQRPSQCRSNRDSQRHGSSHVVESFPLR